VVTSNYDSSNNYVVSTTNQLNKTVSYGNDAYGQATSVTSPTGEVIRYAYDGQERLRTVTDNAQNLTTYGLDANGNVLSVNTKAPSGTIYNQSSFVYDDKNNLQAEKNAANSIVSSYAYDANGRLTQKTNASGSTVSLDYGPLGLLKTLRLSSNETYGFSYDLEGRRKQATVSKTPTGPILHTFDYDYDEVGNLISSIEKGSSGTFIGSITKPAGDMYSKTDQLLGFKLKYLSNPDVLYAFVYSPNKLVEKVSAAGKDTLFKYDEGSKLKLQTNPNGVEDRFDYNEGNQLIGTSTFKPGTDTKITNKYEYDDDGRLKSITRDGSENPTTKYVCNNGTEQLNRLTQAEITDDVKKHTLDYSYDPAGNLKTMELPSGQTNTFAYDGDNKISSLNGSAGNVSYDANGNLTKLTVNGKTQQYVYDAANRLTSVKNGAGTVIASYTYDGDGQRLTKTVGSETITYHYFKGQLMYETSNQYADKVTARYTRTPEGKLLSIYIFRPVGEYWNYYYYHYNAHGDVVAVTDSNGALYRQYAYDPYGNVISVKDGAGDSIDMSADDDFNHAYTYAGYRYDKETGLYFLNARYYNAGIGRFLTKDIVASAKDPQTLNRYAYAKGDPINYVDPDGDFPILIGALVGAGVGAILGAVVSHKTTGSIDFGYVAAGATLGALAGIGLGFFAARGTLVAAGTIAGSISNSIPKDKLYEVATKANSAGLSPAGRAFQKHSQRPGTSFIGEVTGNAAKNSAQGANYLKEILYNPNSAATVRVHKVFGQVLDVRLPNGVGARWSSDFNSFIGFLEGFKIKL